MAGNVITDQISENTAANGVDVDGLAIKDGTIALSGGGTVLGHYEESSISTTWDNGTNTTGSGTIYCTRVGNHVTITIISGVSVTQTVSGLFSTNTAIPSNFRPNSSTVNQRVISTDNGTVLSNSNLLLQADGIIFLGKDNGVAFSGSGTLTLINRTTTISYDRRA